MIVGQLEKYLSVSKIGRWTQHSVSAEPGSRRLSILLVEVVVLMMWTVTPVAEMQQRKVV